MKALSVFRLDGPEHQLVGRIVLEPATFAYDPGYLALPDACALSCSLPLREEPYSEDRLMPYFDGLLPEGTARIAQAAALNVEPDNYLMLLLRCGLEIIGDIAVTEGEPPATQGGYRPLDERNLEALFSSMGELAESNSEARLSLAGTQGKTGLAHASGATMESGWLQPRAGAASTHILKVGALPDVPFLEYLCLKTAAACGIDSPEVDLLRFGRPVLCVARYDRAVTPGGESPHVARLHQEDFAQALGVLPDAKYRELEPSTATAVANLLRTRSTRPLEDIETFARVTLFNYLVGNCDNHLKNLSLLHRPSGAGLRLAPVYDLVSTTRFDRFSRAMGMRLGGASVIDDVKADDLTKFGETIGVDRRELAEIARELAEAVTGALRAAGDEQPQFPELPYVADDLLEDMAPRLDVLDHFAT
ncbi:type II toxin-antitoxin system HipA family toxin [Gordonibacter sp. 28C]|uniref:HipA domain-containing protein n=1 Tax=Gordonibacter sp. 28C TaxID=2078569 RepID=UPI000DF855F2|nr:HipA domain-containing protein [Gordonibacter sp. 28C]RDB63833.1 type II toxin-antitoxin system HipA family toxin [Gordonibacter sp. 28C]